MSPSRRVAVRYLLAKGSFAPEIKKVETLVRQSAYEDALEALDSFLVKQLNVWVAPRRENAHIKTEWLHTLERPDQVRFGEVVKLLLAARHLLMGTAPEGMRIERIIDEVQREIPWLEEVSRGVEDEIKHGPFTIILTAGAGDGLQEAIETLDAAADKIRPKFPKVLYGKVYVRRGLLKGTYEASPHGSSQVAGSYVAGTDTLNLSLYATPDRNSLKTIIHEFGHRYHTRFLNGDQREKFIELSTVGDIQKTHFPLAERKKLVSEIMALLREHQKENYPDADTFLSERASLWWHSYPRDEYKQKVVPLVRRFRDDKDESVADELEHALGQYQYGGNLGVVTNEQEVRPLAASLYGETSWQENFAETFLAYILGTTLPEPLKKFMSDL